MLSLAIDTGQAGKGWSAKAAAPLTMIHHRGDHREWSLLRWNQAYHTVGDHRGDPRDHRGDHHDDHGLNESIHSDRDHHGDFWVPTNQMAAVWCQVYCIQF